MLFSKYHNTLKSTSGCNPNAGMYQNYASKYYAYGDVRLINQINYTKISSVCQVQYAKIKKFGVLNKNY